MSLNSLVYVTYSGNQLDPCSITGSSFSCHLIDNWISSTCHHHLCAGVPNLHRRTRFFPCTSRSIFVGVHETHHSAFTGWWGIPLLWEDIISAVFYHAGGLMFANQKVVFHFFGELFTLVTPISRKSQVWSNSQWMSKISMRGSPLYCCLLRKLCSVRTCMCFPPFTMFSHFWA